MRRMVSFSPFSPFTVFGSDEDVTVEAYRIN